MDDPGFRKGLYLSIEPQGPNMPQGERDRHERSWFQKSMDIWTSLKAGGKNTQSFSRARSPCSRVQRDRVAEVD
jgi:hypothetical protein